MFTSSSSDLNMPTRVFLDTAIIGSIGMGIGRSIQYFGSKLLFNNCEAITDCARNVIGECVGRCGEFVFQSGKLTALIIPKSIFHLADLVTRGTVSTVDEFLSIRKFFTFLGDGVGGLAASGARGTWECVIPALGTVARAGFGSLWWAVSSKPGMVVFTCASIYLAVKVRNRMLK